VHDSVFVPLAKWSMLLTGNYRCIQKGEARSIRDAVHSDIDLSRSVYEWVGKLCQSIGASPEDLVPFEQYANAAKGLAKPTTASRAFYAAATNTERVDCLVKPIARQKGLHLAIRAQTVALVDERLATNRQKAS